MANYAKLQIKAVLSKNTDYSEPTVIFNPAPYEPATADIPEYIHTELLCGTGGVILDTTILDGVSFVVIKNLDATNYVTFTYGTAGIGDATDQAIRIHAGGFFAATDFDQDDSAKLTLTANTAGCQCEVFLVGT